MKIDLNKKYAYKHNPYEEVQVFKANHEGKNPVTSTSVPLVSVGLNIKNKQSVHFHHERGRSVGLGVTSFYDLIPFVEKPKAYINVYPNSVMSHTHEGAAVLRQGDAILSRAVLSWDETGELEVVSVEKFND